MIGDPATANAARNTMRQQQYMRLALLLCMTMLLMDGGSNSNNSRQHSGTKSSGALRGTGGIEKSDPDPASFNQRFEVLLDPTDTKSLNTLMSTRFPRAKVGGGKKELPHNVTGIYRGSWTHTSWTNGSLPNTGAAVMHPLGEGNSLIQLRSVPIYNVPDVKYVYGILKMYAVPTALSGRGLSVNGNGVPLSNLQSTLNNNSLASASPATATATALTGSSKKSASSSSSSTSYISRLSLLKSTLSGLQATEDLTYPVQGLHVPATNECLLVITPSRSHRVYVGVPSSRSSSSIRAGTGSSTQDDAIPTVPVPVLVQTASETGSESAKTGGDQLSPNADTSVPLPPLNPDGTSRAEAPHRPRHQQGGGGVGGGGRKQQRQMQKQGDESVSSLPAATVRSAAGLFPLGSRQGQGQRMEQRLKRKRRKSPQHPHLHRQLLTDTASSREHSSSQEAGIEAGAWAGGGAPALESPAVDATVDPSLSALVWTRLSSVWPLAPQELSAHKPSSSPFSSPSSFSAWMDWFVSLPSSNELLYTVTSALRSHVEATDLHGSIREAVGARSKESTSLFTLLRSFHAKDGVYPSPSSTLSASSGSGSGGGSAVGGEDGDGEGNRRRASVAFRDDLKIFKDILYNDGDEEGKNNLIDIQPHDHVDIVNAASTPRRDQQHRKLQQTDMAESGGGGGGREGEGKGARLTGDASGADPTVTVPSTTTSSSPSSSSSGGGSGSSGGVGVAVSPSSRSLDPRENNLFLLQQHLTLLPNDSFMKAVQRKALAEKKAAAVKDKEMVKDNAPPPTTRAIPFFYAERYPFMSVAGLELLLVDVDRSSRSQQLPPLTSSSKEKEKEKDSPAAKKLTAEMEKKRDSKYIPPSSIPGGLGAATVSNSFLSFVATTGLSTQWLNSIRCTFSLRFMMRAGGAADGGISSEDHVSALVNDILKTKNDKLIPTFISKNSTAAVDVSSSSAPLSPAYFQATLPPSLYEKHTRTGNNIRQLQGTMMGNLVSSACSYPLCTGRERNLSNTQEEANAIVSQSNSNTHDAFTIVASFYKINFEALESKLSTYTFIYTLICFFQAYLLVTQMIASANPAAASRVSILAISAMAVLDAAICILHLLLSSVVSGSAFYYFLWLSFLKLVVFCILEMRFVISIYQARYAQDMAENGWAGLRNHLATLHARFYGALFLVILLVDWYYTRPLVLVFVLYSFWLPQIAFSAVTGGPAPPLTLDFSVYMTLSRLFFPLYTLACPDNFLSMLTDKFQVSYVSAEMTVLWLGLQLGVVFLQHKYGVRFFVPQYFLPVRYNYSRSIAHLFTEGQGPGGGGGGGGERGDAESEKECVICYNVIEETARGSSDYMVTPCDHLFHRECLSQWLDVKMECPVCRAALPIDEA